MHILGHLLNPWLRVEPLWLAFQQELADMPQNGGGKTIKKHMVLLLLSKGRFFVVIV